MHEWNLSLKRLIDILVLSTRLLLRSADHVIVHLLTQEKVQMKIESQKKHF